MMALPLRSHNFYIHFIYLVMMSFFYMHMLSALKISYPHNAVICIYMSFSEFMALSADNLYYVRNIFVSLKTL